jgi:AraC-like DNA-binding protein
MAYNRTALFASLEAYLLDNPGASLSETAAQLNIERHTVERIVREHARRAFRDYQRLARLNGAQRLLGTPASVQEIALALRYSSAAAFSRFFRKETGQSPTEYRLRLENRAAVPAPKAVAAAAGVAVPSSHS